MFAARTATVSLMALMLLCSPVARPRHPDVSSRAVQGAVRLPADSSIALISLARQPRPSSVAPFAPWRSRLKSVLEETNHRVVDDVEIGFVLPPGPGSRSPSVELNDHCLPTAPRLRC